MLRKITLRKLSNAHIKSRPNVGVLWAVLVACGVWGCLVSASAPAVVSAASGAEAAPSAAPASKTASTESALPPASASVSSKVEQPEKRLTPGDEVRIYMQEDPDVTYAGTISASGTVPIPFLGEFRIAGLTCKQAADALSKALCVDLYQRATVSVILTATAPGKVYVYGAVKKPGTVTFPETGRMTILQLLSAVDGLTSWASPEDAYILRRSLNKPNSAPQRIPVNLKEVLTSESPDADVELQPDDVVFVPGLNGNAAQVMTADGCEVIVVGEVNQPGIVVFAPGEQRTLMRAIFKAGGFTRFAKDKAVRLIRYEKGGKRTEIKVNAYEIIEEGYLDKDVALEPGDMLIVPQKLINF